MPTTPIGLMLQDWQRHVIEHHAKEEFPIAIATGDVIRVKALAEVYQLPLEDVIANLLSSALQEVEARMPYVPGKKVIRIEEGEPVYEDIGLTPLYLAAKERIEQERSS